MTNGIIVIGGTAVADSRLYFQPATKNVVSGAANQTYDIYLDSGNLSITAGVIALTYDPAKITITAINEGLALPVKLASSLGTGTARIDLGSQPASPFTGIGKVASISFDVVASGATTDVNFGSNTQLAAVGQTGNVLDSATKGTIVIGGTATDALTPTFGVPTPTAIVTPTPPTEPSQCIDSRGGWKNTSFAPQTGQFTLEFDATPTSLNDANSLYGFIGLSSSPADEYTDLAAIISFHPNGLIRARNGKSYASTRNIQYVLGSTYHFRLVVDIIKQKYSAYVSGPALAESRLASDFVFRTERQNVQSLSNLAAYARTKNRSLKVCNITVAANLSSPNPTPRPGNPTPVTSVQGPNTCKQTQGDADGDGDSDTNDLLIWKNNLGISRDDDAIDENEVKRGDFNCSGEVDGVDFVIWLKGRTNK